MRAGRIRLSFLAPEPGPSARDAAAAASLSREGAKGSAVERLLASGSAPSAAAAVAAPAEEAEAESVANGGPAQQLRELEAAARANHRERRRAARCAGCEAR